MEPPYPQDPYPMATAHYDLILESDSSVSFGDLSVYLYTSQGTGTRSLGSGLEDAGCKEPFVQAKLHV